MSEITPYAWHYYNNGGASVWHRGPSNRLDADAAASKTYPAVHKLIALYDASTLAAKDAEIADLRDLVKRLADAMQVHQNTWRKLEDRCENCAELISEARKEMPMD